MNEPGPAATANYAPPKGTPVCRFARKAFAVRVRRIALPFTHDPAVLDERHAAPPVPLCQSHHTHAIDFKHMSASATRRCGVLDAKEQHRDSILLFRRRLYETFTRTRSSRRQALGSR